MEEDKKRNGTKFVEKYDVKLDSTYKADPDKLVIPPPGHFLHDPDGNSTFNETRVQSIDTVGRYMGAIPVYADTDTSQLYVIDGRGNVLDCREVNRRRRERGDEPIGITVTRFPGTQEEAEDLVAQKNFLRKRPDLGHRAREIARFRRLGRSWKRVEAILGLDGYGEDYLRAHIPLAYCIPEVVSAVDAGKISLEKAKRFGGENIEGADALGREEQLELLNKMLNRKPRAKETQPRMSRAVRAVAVERLTQVESADAEEEVAARGAAAVLRYLDGDETALDALPAIKAALVSARAPEAPEASEAS